MSVSAVVRLNMDISCLIIKNDGDNWKQQIVVRLVNSESQLLTLTFYLHNYKIVPAEGAHNID